MDGVSTQDIYSSCAGLLCTPNRPPFCKFLREDLQSHSLSGFLKLQLYRVLLMKIRPSTERNTSRRSMIARDHRSTSVTCLAASESDMFALKIKYP